MPDVFISRQPLVNRQSKIIATRLTLHLDDGATTADAAKALNALSEVWPHGEKMVFINLCGQPCDVSLLDWPVPDNAILELTSEALLGAPAAELIPALQAAHASLCLVFDERGTQAFASGLAFRFVGLDALRHTPEQLKALAIQTQPHGVGIAFNVFDAQGFQLCIDAGVNAAASWLFKIPPKTPGKALNPSQAQIVRVINLVRKNADIPEIESALKHDVALSYKLLRYINSAGFGLSVEIQSFRHAVTMLGYEKLNRWLSLLLASASKDPMAPAMLHTALTRARLMELLGHDLVNKSEYDNLFITGAFSLLDVMLGVSMDKVLETMSLPEAICDALLGNGGIYGPFLDLAKASEGDDGKALAEQAGMLGLSADQFNCAQMEALAFADTMEL